jgi:hypothetical protein
MPLYMCNLHKTSEPLYYFVLSTSRNNRLSPRGAAATLLVIGAICLFWCRTASIMHHVDEPIPAPACCVEGHQHGPKRSSTPLTHPITSPRCLLIPRYPNLVAPGFLNASRLPNLLTPMNVMPSLPPASGQLAALHPNLFSPPCTTSRTVPRPKTLVSFQGHNNSRRPSRPAPERLLSACPLRL